MMFPGQAVCITVDLDNLWIDGLAGSKDAPNMLPEGVENALALFQEYNVKATFFVLGEDCISRENLAVLRKAANYGHEIAFHGRTHKPYPELSVASLKEEIVGGLMLMREAGFIVKGHRAPSWACPPAAYPLLAGQGMEYDISRMPALLGIPVRLVERIKKSAARHIYGDWRTNLGVPRKTSLRLIDNSVAYLLPFYATLHIYNGSVGMNFFHLQWWSLRYLPVINYTFHLIDFVEGSMGVKWYGGDRMVKRRNIAEVLATLTRDRNAMPLGALPSMRFEKRME